MENLWMKAHQFIFNFDKTNDFPKIFQLLVHLFPVWIKAIFTRQEFSVIGCPVSVLGIMNFLPGSNFVFVLGKNFNPSFFLDLVTSRKRRIYYPIRCS